MSEVIARRPLAFHSVCLAFALAAICATAVADERPNIILCMGDDHGWDETVRLRDEARRIIAREAGEVSG